MSKTYDRYSLFRSDGKVDLVPFGKVREKDSDFFEVYKKNKTRLDILSYNYYKNPDYGWLILQANPEVGSMEYNIKDGATLRIPYPLSASLQDYIDSIEEYYRLYGNEEQ